MLQQRTEDLLTRINRMVSTALRALMILTGTTVVSSAPDWGMRNIVFGWRFE